jgi:hypothetical protein
MLLGSLSLVDLNQSRQRRFCDDALTIRELLLCVFSYLSGQPLLCLLPKRQRLWHVDFKINSDKLLQQMCVSCK